MDRLCEAWRADQKGQKPIARRQLVLGIVNRNGTIIVGCAGKERQPREGLPRFDTSQLLHLLLWIEHADGALCQDIQPTAGIVRLVNTAVAGKYSNFDERRYRAKIADTTPTRKAVKTRLCCGVRSKAYAAQINLAASGQA